MGNFNILTIGDAMITFNPHNNGPLRFVQSFSRSVGGAELNFAIGCARLQLGSTWISRLGNDEFGKVIYNFARGEGVNMRHVQMVDGYPTSLNFKETQQTGENKTFYYRHQTPIATIKMTDITNDLLNDVSLLHISGVFLALLPQNLNLVLHLLTIAKAKNIPVSFDPNIRLKLWSLDDAKSAYEKIYPFVDLFLAGKEELELLLLNTAIETLATFAKQYDIKEFVMKDGKNGSKLYFEGTWYEKEAFEVHAVDTVGAGDGFDAGYVYSYLNNFNPEKKLTFANAVGALVTTVMGDNEGLPELDQVIAFINQEKIIER